MLDVSTEACDPTTPTSNHSTLTRIEWLALMTRHNLADGHARQGVPTGVADLVDKLPKIFRHAEANQQLAVQQDFERVLFGAAGQPSVIKRPQEPLHHYSSSLSIEVIANHLRLEQLRVGLLCPTFDNIPDILKRHGVPLVPVGEEVFIDPGALDAWDEFDALFLVTPNNPTGLDPHPEMIERIALECQRRGVLLILDFSFRFFSDHLNTRDLYAFFEEHKIDHVGIEDVGKVWPMLDLKLGTLVCGSRRHSALRAITDDLLLNVSPFVFALIAESGRAGVVDHARSISVSNRAALVKALDGGPVSMIPSGATMSVAWLQLKEGWDCLDVGVWLQERGICVLPGRPFFWACPEEGARFIRIALMRPLEYFETAAKAMAHALIQYERDVKGPSATTMYGSRARLVR